MPPDREPSLGYFTGPQSVPVNDQQFTQDDADNSTLRAVYKVLKEQMAELDAWHAFDLKDTDGLTIKQQIKAHQLAFEILETALTPIETTLNITDEKHRS